MQNFIIHHDADIDGLASCYVASLALPNATRIGYDYNRPTDAIDAIPDNSEVVMLDISLKPADMVALAKRSGIASLR